MELRGFTPATLADYETFRSRHVPLAGVNPQETPYQLVGRIASSEIPAALIETYGLQLRPDRAGRVALSGLLLSDDFNEGVRYFKMIEALDDQDRPTLYPEHENAIQLHIPQYGRMDLSFGYLIGRAPQGVDVLSTPAYFETHNDEYESVHTDSITIKTS
jgi:hypothetical protein